jgi:hypothetical protein
LEQAAPAKAIIMAKEVLVVMHRHLLNLLLLILLQPAVVVVVLLGQQDYLEVQVVVEAAEQHMLVELEIHHPFLLHKEIVVVLVLD